MTYMLCRILERIACFGCSRRASCTHNDRNVSPSFSCGAEVSKACGQDWTSAWFTVQLINIAAGRLRLAPEVLKPVAQRLKTRGKPYKLVIVAIARRLGTIANAILTTGVLWQPQLGT